MTYDVLHTMQRDIDGGGTSAQHVAGGCLVARWLVAVGSACGTKLSRGHVFYVDRDDPRT